MIVTCTVVSGRYKKEVEDEDSIGTGSWCENPSSIARDKSA